MWDIRTLVIRVNEERTKKREQIKMYKNVVLLNNTNLSICNKTEM